MYGQFFLRFLVQRGYATLDGDEYGVVLCPTSSYAGRTRSEYDRIMGRVGVDVAQKIDDAVSKRQIRVDDGGLIAVPPVSEADTARDGFVSAGGHYT